MPNLEAIFGTIVVVLAALAVIGAAVPGRTIFERDVRAEEPALVALLLLSIPAYLVLRARDSRRFVIGAIRALPVQQEARNT